MVVFIYGFFVVVAAPLSNIIESTIDEDKLIKNATAAENVSLQQQSLIAIKLLSMHLAKDNPAAFKHLLDILSAIFKSSDTVPLNVLAQSMLCLAEICSNLRSHAISHLSKFMPSIGRILQAQIRSVHTTSNIIVYLLTAIHKIVETLPLFLSPYLVQLICSLSLIWAKLDAAALAASQDSQRKLMKLEAIWKKLANSLTLRILIPMITQSYQCVIGSRDTLPAVGPLMQLLTESLTHLTGADIQPFQNDLGTFFVDALQYRSDNSSSKSDVADTAMITAQEDHIIRAFVALVMKLSESSFRPLYFKIHDWAAIRSADDDDQTIERAITFYRYSLQ